MRVEPKMADSKLEEAREVREATGEKQGTRAPPGPRESLVSVAAKFLKNPQVVDSPAEQKRAFLRKKGLSDGEIEEAFQLSESLSGRDVSLLPPVPPRTPSQHSPFTTHTPPHHSWRDYALVMAVVGGVGFALYKFVKVYVVPWLSLRLEESERVEEIGLSLGQLQTHLDTSVAELNETTTTIRDILTEQQQQIQAIAGQVTALQSSVPASGLAVKEIRDEVASLKGLLLNRHQFPPPTVTHTLSRGIPSWQRSTPPQQQQQPEQQLQTFQDTVSKEAAVNGEEDGDKMKAEEEEEED